MAANQPGLLRLPVEIQQEIVGYTTSKADLKSLCLTCEEVQSVANPPLYQSIVLGTSQLGKEVKQALHEGNPGMGHVRSLRIHEYGKAYRHNVHGVALCHVLQALPKGSLTFFELDTYQAISLDIVFLLRTRQHRLTNYQEQRLSSSSISYTAPDKADFGSITRVQLYLDSSDACERAGQLLQRSTHVKRLDVSVAGDISFGKTDKAENHIELLRCLFPAAVTDGTDACKLQLECLTLRKFDLQYVGGFDMYDIDSEDVELEDVLASVHELVLEDCEEVNKLLERWKFPHLKKVKVVRAEDFATMTDTMQAFLENTNALEEVHVSYVKGAEYYAFGWASLERHASSLRLLFLDDEDTSDSFNDDYFDRSPLAFRQLCRSCDKLEQLAIMMPNLKGTHWADPDRLVVFLSGLRHLKALKTLRLFALPEYSEFPELVYNHQAALSGLMETVRKSVMQDLANKIFDELSEGCPDLVGLVIDTREPGQDCRSRNVKRFGFLRARQTDLCGRTKAFGIPIAPHIIKHHEPCSEIFEHGFGPV